jgi:predicted NAD/FAD-binding protein
MVCESAQQRRSQSYLNRKPSCAAGQSDPFHDGPKRRFTPIVLAVHQSQIASLLKPGAGAASSQPVSIIAIYLQLFISSRAAINTFV